MRVIGKDAKMTKGGQEFKLESVSKWAELETKNEALLEVAKMVLELYGSEESYINAGWFERELFDKADAAVRANTLGV